LKNDSSMKSILFLFALYIVVWWPVHADEKPEEKSYSERLKEVASEKLRQSKDLYDKGVKVASDKYAETFEEGKDLSGKSREWLLKDIQNIGDWEYKIEKFSLKNSKDLEIRLNQLGAERWQCFWVEQGNDNTKSFYFKRNKMSYLSKIPTGALLRIMADFGNE
jgi:biopolymer transport protein ExbB/TolQ